MKGNKSPNTDINKGATVTEGESPRLSVDEVAELLGATPRTVQRYCAQGKYPGLTKTNANGGEQYRILLSSLPETAQHKYHLEQARADAAKMAENPDQFRALNDEAEALAREQALADAAAGKRKRKVQPLVIEPLSQEQAEALWDWFQRSPAGVQREAKENLEIMLAHQLLQQAGARPGAIVRELRAKYGVSEPTVWRLRERIKGQPSHLWLPLLAPKWKGRTAMAEFTEDAWLWIKEHWGQQSKPKLKPIVDHARQMASAKSWVIPSIDTVRDRIDAQPRWWKVYRREGDKALAALYPAMERDYSTLAVHELWCADGHKADLFCRWVEVDGKVTVGRPIVVAWMDIRSRYFLGYAVGRVESADLIRLAFKKAAENAHAIPWHMLLDNGRGFASKLLTGGIPNRYRFKVKDEDIPGIFKVMGIDVHWATPGHGQAKPIEPGWRFVPERVCKRAEFQGAYCGNKPDAKPEEFDSAKAVPIEQFLTALAEEVYAHNRRAHRGDSMHGRSPYQVMEELLPQTRVRQPTAAQLRLCLLAAEAVKPDKKDGAFWVLNNRYWTEKCADLDAGVAYIVRFDPEDASQPISIYDGEAFLFDAPIVSKSGFRNQEAAKEHARSRSRFKKSRKEQAKAMEGMDRAERWTTEDGVTVDPETGEILNKPPLPKVAELVRLQQKPAAVAEEGPTINPGELMRRAVEQQRKNATNPPR
ncbi:MAG: helix-turn-helix domain-containing protein [Methylococcaceae bacterium]|nr:MAG: helix-turn-helix domain-containing protein [Methylococcaceae bacterium]